MFNQGLTDTLATETLHLLAERAASSRRAVLTATSLANSGHPGGSFSSLEIYTLLYSLARLRPEEPRWADRDRIVVSHGHTSPGVYAALAAAGFFETTEFVAHFRQAGSVFEGHVEREVPGVDWSTGNLGQGLSAGVGLAIGAALTGSSWRTYVCMSDGEQMKGQVGEARRLAAMRGLSNITAIVDWNRVQISGHTNDVMRVPLVADWEADGWTVFECDGHDFAALHATVVAADGAPGPAVVLARTLIGKGVSFMEDVPEFHGRALNAEEFAQAMSELGGDPGDLEAARAARQQPCSVDPMPRETPLVTLCAGQAREYASDKPTDNRSAWGNALVDVAAANEGVPMAVLDCDLAVSVKTDGFAASRPDGFIQCGVGEHNAATVGGALSTVPGVVAVWSDFGAFGIDEVYNQQRLNDINGAALKLVVTHCGLDVGEDGKTHQCLDYVGALRELPGWRVIVPADPNQTDRATRTMLSTPGCVAMAMGRSKLPVIADADGRALFGGDYRFNFGEVVWARRGGDAAIVAMGTVASAAAAAADELAAQGLDVAVGIVATPLEIDAQGLREAAATGLIITAEDHGARTGLGASVAEWLAETAADARLVRLGVEGYQSSGSATDLFAAAGLDTAGIMRAVADAIAAGE